MRATTLIIALILMLSPVAMAHKFNHEDQHEICDIFGGPHGHSVGDGHAHTHDLVAGKALNDHDPCKQIRMKYPDWQDKAPISEIDAPKQELLPKDLLFSDGDPTDSEVWIGGEAYQFPIPEGTFKVQTNFAILSDLQAAGMGLPGSGTHADPYIVEGYIIKGNMVFKDTSKCFVVRNNVIVNRVIPAPLVPDPPNIIELPPLIPIWELKNETAHMLRQEWQELKAEKDALKAQIDAEKAEMDADKAEWEQQMDDWEAEWTEFALRYVQDAVEYTEGLAGSFESYASQYSSVQEPPKPHAPHVNYGSNSFIDRDAAIQGFEDYQVDVQDWIAANPPPENPPAGWPGSASGWQVERGNYQSYQDEIAFEIEWYWSDLMANAPDEAAYDAFVIAYNQFMDAYAEFMEEYNAFMADYNAFMVQFNSTMASTQKDINDAKAFFAKVAKWTYEYVGKLGTYLYNTLDELVKWVLNKLQGILDPNDPNLVAQNTGQLILDWNGQCVHAYNNVINDLRVNQNNDRTGYATGGILEDNRIYTIGQIRHYDGIFRENEVGNRAHLKALMSPGIVPAANSVRSVNNDGANQGWYVDNVFYGQIDLDFHGHHHSAGFFAPTSHYHGSLDKVVRMYDPATGLCTTRESQVNQAKFNGPEKDYPQDDSIEVFGDTVLDRTPDQDECLEHFDHSKRWTSVLFSENTVIDPNGVGLRFEDRDHRADDEQAASENVLSLKRPHYHQKWVQLEDNTVVGKIYVDVLNAAGTNLWTDDWSPVQSPAGTPRTQEALAHPGAEIVNSHPYRNDAWLDINGNSIFQTQTTGVLVADADDLKLFQLKDNRGYGLPSNFASGKTLAQFLAWLEEARDRPAADVHADIKAWGGSDRGVQTFASLSNLRDAFTVQHCGNVARGLDRGLIATDRIYDDGNSIIMACGTSDWGTADPAVSITYTPMTTPPPRCTEELRQMTAETDDFYASELAYDTVDPLMASQVPFCQSLPVPSEPPVTPSQPVPDL